MTTLFDATLSLARRVTPVREDNGTSATTTTIMNTAAQWAVNIWQAGTIWIENTAKSLVVSSNTATTITFPTTTAPSHTTKYSLANKDYPRDILRMAINQALRELRTGVTETIYVVANDNQASITLTLPDVLRVEVETFLGSGEYRLHQNWHEVEGALRLMDGYEVPAAGQKVRVTTRTAHVDLALDADIIPPTIDYELLIWKACTHALRWGLGQYGQDPAKHVTELLNEAQAEVTKRSSNRVHLTRTTRVGGW